jgi:2-C-methyl-D-erythritol 2,4-cyclodiphosphate synthase
LKSADETLPRTGCGYDVHRLVSGRKLILGGVEIPSPLGLEGHSDGDVLIHAVMDALLGAAALGDIGKHFPNTDPRYLGISSLLLLKHVAGLLDSRGFALVNVDATLVLEQPKILSYAERMRGNIADALGVPVERISLKATTGEEMGFVGRGEGAAAHAIATIVRH